MSGYEYLTERQAGILYGAVKRGELFMERDDIRRMYDIVEMQWGWMSPDERSDMRRYESALDHYMNGRVDVAQAVLDGRPVYEEQVQVGTEWVEPNLFDYVDDWGSYDPSALVEEPVYETRWVIGRRRRL